MGRAPRPRAEPADNRIEPAADELTVLSRGRHLGPTSTAHRDDGPDGLSVHVYAAPADVERLRELGEERVLEWPDAELPLYLLPLDTAGR